MFASAYYHLRVLQYTAAYYIPHVLLRREKGAQSDAGGSQGAARGDRHGVPMARANEFEAILMVDYDTLFPCSDSAVAEL